MVFALFLQQNAPDLEQLQKLIVPLVGFFIFSFLIGVAINLVPCWFICKKAGFSPWLSFLVLFPGLGLLVLLYVLAFADWRPAPFPSQAWAPQPPYPPQPYPPQPPRPPQV